MSSTLKVQRIKCCLCGQTYLTQERADECVERCRLDPVGAVERAVAAKVPFHEIEDNLDAAENQLRPVTGDVNVESCEAKVDPMVCYLHTSRKMESYLDKVESPDKPDMMRLLALMGDSVLAIVVAPGASDPIKEKP